MKNLKVSQDQKIRVRDKEQESKLHQGPRNVILKKRSDIWLQYYLLLSIKLYLYLRRVHIWLNAIMPKYTIDQLSERVPKLNKDQSGLTLHQLWLRNPDTLNGGILYYLDIYLFKPYYKSLDDFGNKTTYYPAVYSGYINDELIQFLSLECRFSFGALHFHYGITPPRIRN